MRKKHRSILGFFGFLMSFGLATGQAEGALLGKVFESEGQKFQIETLLERSDVIWGFDFLPDSQVLITERGGKLLRFDPKTSKVSTIKGVPKVAIGGQGGLLDVRVHPQFKSNQWVYLSYSEPRGDKATTALARAKLQNDQLIDLKVLFSGKEPSDNVIHFGSRIEFDGKGHVFFTMGDRYQADRAQDLSFHNGKVLRLNEDGSVPKDNPFVKKTGALPEIYSYGHRNPQGLILNSNSNELWEIEFGPLGGDEVNLVKPGLNYGWPVVTFGREYSGSKIGEGTAKAGMEPPVVYWTPSISPSGAALYQGDTFSKWKGNLFLGCLGTTHIRRIVLDGSRVVKQEELIKDLSLRVRHIRTGNDGTLYFSTDEGKLMKIVPAKKT